MKENNISDLKLERYFLGELPSRELNKIKSLLETDQALSERLDNLRKSNEDILSLYKSSEIAERIQRRLRASEAEAYTRGKSGKKAGMFRRYKFLMPALSAAVLAAVMIPIVILYIGNGNDYRVKGQASLLIYRKTASGGELLKNSDNARKGDLLQLGYTAGRERYGAIFSIDGRGNLTWHFPLNVSNDTRLEQGRRALLPESYELDNAPEFERFFFVMSDKKINLSDVILNAGILAGDPGSSGVKSLELFKNYQVIVITLLKRD